MTKDQERNKRNKEVVRIRKSKFIKPDRTHCYTGKFNIAFSLCEVLEITFYFFKGFLEAAAEALQFLEVTVVCFLGQEYNL